MIKYIKEWLFQYSYTRYLAQLNKYKHAKIELDKTDQFAIIELLKHLGAKKCTIRLYQAPKQEILNVNLSQLEIKRYSFFVPGEHDEPLELDFETVKRSTISFKEPNIMVFELTLSKSFYTEITIPLPTSMEDVISESKRLAKEDR